MYCQGESKVTTYIIHISSAERMPEGGTRAPQRSQYLFTLGVKIRNLKVYFKTGGTWRWVGQ